VEVKYLPEFVNSLKKYASIKSSVKNKIESLLKSPLGYGEPLKYDLQGLSSCSVKRNFLIIYVYCRECRIKNYQSINACSDCNETPDETIKFLTIAPHDMAYNINHDKFR
jgi:mRNA-degrading endonuclease YafQ of YafQ-DinJ toxin-antitoxin module